MGIAEIKARLAAAKLNSAGTTSERISSTAEATSQTPKPAAPVQKSLILTQEKNLPSGSELYDKVIELQTSLLDRHPRMPGLLREIHTALRAQPENVTLLSEDQISVIVNGLKVQTGVEFAAAATKGTAKGIKSKIAAQGLDAF